MTQDEIIEMARQAGLLVIGTADGGEAVYTWPAGITEEIKSFAKLIAEKEREACAKTVEKIETYEKIEKACFKFAAKTIRARGEK